MKQVIPMIVLALLAAQLSAQQFHKEFELSLPDSIQETQTAWVDLDNDGLFDILLLSETTGGNSYLQFIKGDTVNVPTLHLKSSKIISPDVFSLVDYNHDNQMDIVVSGQKEGMPVTVVYINKGAFDFQESEIFIPSFQSMKFADLDNDARPEWILSGEENGQYFTRIFKQQSAFAWSVVHDSLKIKASALEVIDANGDGNMDIFISGRVSPDSVITQFLINQGSLYFKPEILSPNAGLTSTGDVNGDGFLDMLTIGRNGQDMLLTELYESEAGTYVVKNDPVTLDNGRPFVADFNSDGKVDKNFTGKLPPGDTLNIIRYSNGNEETLPSTQRIAQYFGDVEHDGDLDLLQLVQGEQAIQVEIYENKPLSKNRPPGSPKNGVAIPVFNRLFLYWDKAADDHTISASLTYDVYMDGSPTFQSGAFDLLNSKRLTVEHGNNGTKNFRLLQKVSPENFGFAVQAVDNSFHGGAQCIGIGSGQPCGDIDRQFETLSACAKEEINLTSPPDALWFSFSKGFLGIRNALRFQAEKKDTIFYYTPSAPGCAGLKVWTIEINNDTLKVELSEIYTCQGSELQFNVEPGWENVQWKSGVKGELGSADEIAYTVGQADSVFVTLTNLSGCTIIRKTAIKLSEPVLHVAEENYKILKGTQVQLSVQGAQRYEWTPSTGLDRSDIANPVASPASSTQYTVTGFDSLGCTDKATVNIIVEGAGFIPTLFTPNDDGKNDQLKLYGLPVVKEFDFSIYNREGILVYRTSNAADAEKQGWDGAKNGTRQPAGVYFWKVKGHVPSGERILLNGKDSGSVVLVR